MHRFYCPSADFQSKQIFITNKDEIHHLADVLRLKKSSPVSLFNKNGEEGLGKIIAIDRAQVIVQIDSYTQYSSKIPPIILACAIPKKGKFELIIEKSTELGVSEIMPLKTKRTEVSWKGARLQSKIERFNKVAINAAKQSKRSTVPLIHSLTDFNDALTDLTARTTVIIPSLEEKSTSIFKALKKIKANTPISIFIGPEGDFTPQEYAQAKKCDCLPVTLGETILKVETAALCAVSCCAVYSIER